MDRVSNNSPPRRLNIDADQLLTKTTYFTFGQAHISSVTPRKDKLSKYWVEVITPLNFTRLEVEALFKVAFTQRFCPNEGQWSLSVESASFDSTYYPGGCLCGFIYGSCGRIIPYLKPKGIYARVMLGDEANLGASISKQKLIMKE